MNFTTAGHVVEEKEYVSKFMKPGIHIAKIKNVEFYQSQGGTPGIKLALEGPPMKELENAGQTCETTYWLSPKAWEFTKSKLVTLADKLGVREQLDAISVNDGQEYANALASVFTGLAGRFKLKGTEIEGKVGDDGTKKNNWFKAEIAAFGFVEPASLPASESKLKFDESSKYDMVRLAPADVESDDPLAGDEGSPW